MNRNRKEGDRETCDVWSECFLMGTDVNMSLSGPGTFTLRLRVSDLEVSSLRFKVAAPRDMEQDAGPLERLAGSQPGGADRLYR